MKFRPMLESLDGRILMDAGPVQPPVPDTGVTPPPNPGGPTLPPPPQPPSTPEEYLSLLNDYNSTLGTLDNMAQQIDQESYEVAFKQQEVTNLTQQLQQLRDNGQGPGDECYDALAAQLLAATNELAQMVNNLNALKQQYIDLSKQAQDMYERLQAYDPNFPHRRPPTVVPWAGDRNGDSNLPPGVG